MHHIKWDTPFKDESLQHYAMRLSKQIDSNKPFVLVGVSFGGMCSVEISKELRPLKTFIISSAKTGNEIPLKMKIFRKLPIHKLMNDDIFKKSALLIKKQFGIFSGEQKKKFLEMLDTAPKNYFVGAINCIINWNNTTYPENVIHIHGTADKVLPIKKDIKYDYLIERGTHFMIINRGEEISKIINDELITLPI